MMSVHLRRSAGLDSLWRRPPLAGEPWRQNRSPEIVLDLSRLLSRVLHPSPTGVDRVEMAYARTLLKRAADRVAFGAVHPIGLYGRIPNAAVERFLDQTERRWEYEGAFESDGRRRQLALAACWSLRPRRVIPPRGPRVLVQASPNHLDRHGTVIRKLQRERAKLLVLVHDLIPITHPEYARPDGQLRHWRRLKTLACFADGLIANSRATAEMLGRHAGVALDRRPVRIAPLSLDTNHWGRSAGGTPWSGKDYFVCVGTIEPRKNHLLLLNLWRSMVEMRGVERTPHLILVGRRGWENENIVDMLDRCTSIGDRVREYRRLPDTALRPLLRDARALLMPSFTEGFGLPIVEALNAGVPVIASDIPAHREAGGDVPEYLDPVDGLGWREAILAYADAASERRTAQLGRLATWRPASWDSHIDAVLSLADEVWAC